MGRAPLEVIGWLRRRPWIHLWGPVLLWMSAIFYFSSRPQPLGRLSRSEHSEVIGKAAHFAEYAGLAALLHRALSSLHSPSSILPSFLIGLVFALLDEVHHRFVPGRDAELSDVAFDTIGMGVALIAIAAWRYLGGRGRSE